MKRNTLLVLSLALNLIVVGLAVGLYFAPPPDPLRMITRRIESSLEAPADKRALQQSLARLENTRAEMHPVMGKWHREMQSIIGGPVFNPEQLREHLGRLQLTLRKAQDSGFDVLIAFLSGLDADTRRRIAENLPPPR